MNSSPTEERLISPGSAEIQDAKPLMAKGSDSQHSYKYHPKVEIKSQNSLYIISYSDIPPLSRVRSADAETPTAVAAKACEFNIFLYIDIPTIDYYNDELTNNKRSKFNRRFKLHLLRDSIFNSFTNGNLQFWDQIMSNNHEQKKKCTISISSSGSLRYVETTKFLIEACYEKLAAYIDAGLMDLRFKLEVSPTSHKWFTTFLNKKVVKKGIIEFIDIGSYSKISETISTPFKEYYAQLNAKFASHPQCNEPDSAKSLDSIIIITNSTGVKALLTILSDRPLTSYIFQESIDALHDNALRKKDMKKISMDSSEEETPLKRESSSLLSFQNSLLTSNKDKSVKIRSLSLNRRSNRAQVFKTEEIPNDATSSGSSVMPVSPSRMDSPIIRSNLAIETKFSFDEDADCEEIEEEDDDDDYDEGNQNDDDGISFSVPSKLSRSGSSTDIASNSLNSNRRGRFRSLSLMDPALKGPFFQPGIASLEITEDEMSSNDGSRITNIYVHDGEFDELDANSSRKGRKKFNKNLLSRQNSSNGLIPPEFYSRISSPSTSASSSTSSLQNLNLAPGTFSKWLAQGDLGTSTSNVSNSDLNPLFEKSLINKSFEETRKRTSTNLFSTLMGGLNNKNPLALNFRPNKTIPPDIQIMDEEDKLMSGLHNGNSNFSAEETSEDESRSTSTVVPEKYNAMNDSNDNNMNDRTTNETAKVGTSFKNLNLNLNLQLYDNNNNDLKGMEKNGSTDQGTTQTNESLQRQELPKPKYKKAITLDLYGDDDLDSMGGWILGGNAR